MRWSMPRHRSVRSSANGGGRMPVTVRTTGRRVLVHGNKNERRGRSIRRRDGRQLSARSSNDDLKAEGPVDETVGKVEAAVGRTSREVGDAITRVGKAVKR